MYRNDTTCVVGFVSFH